MSIKKEKKVKKLKRKRIGTPIVLFVIFSGLAVFFTLLFADFFLSYVLDEKAEVMGLEAERLVHTIEKQMSGGMELAESAELVGDNAHYDTEFCIIDADGETIVQKSYKTPDTDVLTDFEQTSSTRVYVEDEVSTNFFSVNKLMKLFTGTIETWDYSDRKWPTLTAAQLPCWISKPISGTKGELFLRGTLILTNKDVSYLIMTCFFMFAIMLIPMIILFINAVSSFVMQRRMIALLYLDAVTGGKNALFLKNNGEKTLRRVKNAKNSYGVLDIQMSKYQNYCSCHGVSAGEELLETIYEKLQFNMKRGDICVRYSEADFALLVRCDSREQCEAFIKGCIQQLAQLSSGHRLFFQVGAYFEPPNLSDNTKRSVRRRDVNVPEMYNMACAARASIEGNEESGYAFFDHALLDDQIWEHKVEDMMELALDKEEFKVYLQPKYSPVDGRMVGAEALVRWISPSEGFISPGSFIPIFERNGFILQLDDYMISHVAKQLSDWLAEGKDVVPVSVNVSRAHFSQPDLAEHIKELVDTYNTPHEYIELELTESAFFDDKKMLLKTVNKLQSYGFIVSMDDFGAGYSSLNSLKDLPLDILKLDAEFFRGEEGGQRGEIVVSEAIQLAKNLNMKVVAEGIEKKEQVDFLASLECDMIQGFYFAKPMPVSEFEKLGMMHGETA